MTTPEYHYGYNKERYKRVRKAMFDVIGNSCKHCGSTEQLEIDHIDSSNKSFDVSKNWAFAWNLILEELNKCQPLCNECHKIKSIADHGKTPAKNTHGTLSAYRYCKCEECKAAKRVWARNYALTHVRKSRRSSTG